MAQNVFETSFGSFLLTGPKRSESNQQLFASPPFSVQFTNNTPNEEYYDFIWYFGDGQSLASNSRSVFHEYQEDGSYHVKLVAYEHDFGSVDSVEYENYISSTGSITSLYDKESIQTPVLNIQPNPFRIKTTIRFENPANECCSFRDLFC